MSEPPKPGRLLVVNSVAVIALCSLAMSAGSAEMLGSSWENAPFASNLLVAIVIAGVFYAPLTGMALSQYRGTFCGDGRAAGRAAALALLASVLLWPGALGVLLVGAIAVLGDREPRLGHYLGLIMSLVLMFGLAGFATFTARINFQWSQTLGAIGQPPQRRQFSIRDLLAVTIWIALVAGLARWMVIGGR